MQQINIQTKPELPPIPLKPSRLRVADPLISLVMPSFNEQETILLFVDAINAHLSDHKIEMVFVNDGSSDATFQTLLDLSARDPRVVVVNLSRNFGKEIAMTAGLEHATGDVVVPMDADLHDPREVIPSFLERWREGFDVFDGLRLDRASDTMAKRTTAGMFYRLFNRPSQTEMHANAGDFRLIDRVAVDALKRLPERSRFMKGLFAWVGYPSIGVGYVRPKRAAGTTSFSYWKLWNFALDGIVSFSTIPVRIWTYVGCLVAVMSVCYATAIVVRSLIFGRDVPGYASIVFAVLFLGGGQLMSLGVIGEYLSRLFLETKRRPLYLAQGVYRNGQNFIDINTVD